MTNLNFTKIIKTKTFNTKYDINNTASVADNKWTHFTDAFLL